MKPPVIVVGASGHAKVCIELLQAIGETVLCCVGAGDDGATCLGIPVLDGDHHLARLRDEGQSRAFVALGSNRLRARLGGYLRELGFELVNAISPHAVVSPSATLGSGIAIMAGAVVNADATIGDLAIVNTGATVDHDCIIGVAAHVAPQCALAGNVSIGDGAFLGVGCKAVPWVEVGAQSTVGAGAVIISAIPPRVTAVGVPARVLNKQPNK
ncbi:acetyltransferase [Massilia sp. Mn16-1_5]|uniref:acetyltransferase n=1 Tax=Massilia sp. Mn16-1_5 TaxID=2079199 RepID=UPI00109E3F45|nr:acetyltransferase [Massilia sp. Mn16-1_5]THC45657.1 hexapeptide transferase [Massilia sp. Mn16-1_5]